MPSKLKTISVRPPNDVREWVEAKKGSTGGFIVELLIREFQAETKVFTSNDPEVGPLIHRPLFGPTPEQLDFRRRLLS